MLSASCDIAPTHCALAVPLICASATCARARQHAALGVTNSSRPRSATVPSSQAALSHHPRAAPGAAAISTLVSCMPRMYARVTGVVTANSTDAAPAAAVACLPVLPAP